ncbi:MAG TPA: MtrB/PioB family decaheme-associated outer membrane protein [Acidiferrobacterales bacterium]|nr:MtrB/PioB family decaheme-associated outer membrane protein [Acidiferrobacterales bacterium]
MNTQPRNTIRPSALTMALLALSVTALAAEPDEVTELSRPESTVSAGIGYVSDDSLRFGQYTGMHEEGAYGLAEIDIAIRNDDTGTWTLLEGRNLGLDNRDLRFEHRRQGDWGYFLEYSQIPRFEPFTPTTAVTGIGTPNLSVPTTATAGVPVEMKTTRDVFGFGLDKAFTGNLDVRVRYQQQEKNGERLFARGTTGSGGFQFAPEPINSTTRMLESTVGYTDKKLQLSGGYYGTLYESHDNALNITEVGAPTTLAGFTPMALPPDNQAHQLFVAGGYNITETARTTFKAAYTHATQHETFILPSSATGRTDLGGEVDTTLLQAGFTARPLSKLSVLANLRHENRDDKTPVADYFSVTTGTTFTGENEPRSIKTNNAKLEATYALPMSLRMTGGIDYDMKERNYSEVRVVSARTETNELSYRLALRRSISETLTGSLGVVRSQRDGSDYLTTLLTTAAMGSNLIAPIHYADRDRDKVRLSLNWMPVDLLSVQLVADTARDDYTARTAENLGPRKGTAENYALDMTFMFSEDWQMTAWASRNKNQIDQATCEAASSAGVCPNTVADPFWQVSLRNLGNAGGLGLRAKLTSKLELGGDLQHSVYNDEYSQLATTPGAVAPIIPDIETRVTAIRLTAKYALMKSAGIRFDYAYQRWTSDDWTWSTWTYTDGTQLLQEPVQKVHFFGVSGYYRWW